MVIQEVYFWRHLFGYIFWGTGNTSDGYTILYKQVEYYYLRGIHSSNYTAPGMFLAISGVGHDELVSIEEPPLSDLPGVTRHEESKSVYAGGIIVAKQILQ